MSTTFTYTYMGDFLRFLAKLCHIICFCTLFFSCCSIRYYVYEARELADPHQRAMELNKSLKPASTCSSSSQGLEIQKAHSDGPCSAVGQQNPRLSATRQILHQDRRRAGSLSSTGDLDSGTKLSLQKQPGGGDNYVVKVGFGTPTRYFTLMFDTGSDISWIQCQPCISCYEPIYDPSNSSSFSNASCPSTCQYTQIYHDNSYISGYFIQDTLTISTSYKFTDFVFLCGQNKSENWGQVAGVLGMALSDASLLSQTLTRFWETFCYCLPSSETSSGFLVLGEEAYTTCSPEITTNFEIAGPSGSIVSLVGITIGRKRLQVSSNDGSSSEKAIIDSGTVISRLPATLYSELSSSFKEMMSTYPVAPASDPMDTCYNLEGYDIQSIIPSMTLHFDNSLDLNLDQSSVVWNVRDSQFCLAFARDSSTIIGNYHQRNKRIYYDIMQKEIGISSGGCGNR